MITTNNINEARKEIQKLAESGQEIIVRAGDDSFNRKIFEIKDVDMVVGLELHDRRDFFKQRDSGLNEVLCKLANVNNICIGVDVSGIGRLGKLEKSRALARVRQNIGLCKRVGCRMVLIGNGLDKQDVMSFFLSLNGSTVQARNAIG